MAHGIPAEQCLRWLENTEHVVLSRGRSPWIITLSGPRFGRAPARATACRTWDAARRPPRARRERIGRTVDRIAWNRLIATASSVRMSPAGLPPPMMIDTRYCFLRPRDLLIAQQQFSTNQPERHRVAERRLMSSNLETCQDVYAIAASWLGNGRYFASCMRRSCSFRTGGELRGGGRSGERRYPVSRGVSF